MFASIRTHARSNVVAYVALFVALGGTGAYAANTIGSSDVVNESLLSEDFKHDTLTRGDLAQSTLSGHYVLDESLSFFDLAPGTIVNSRLADNAINSAKVASDSLSGDDVNEATLGNARTATKVRLPAPTPSGAAGTPVNVPLTGNTWSQPLGESERMSGEVTITDDGTCASGGFPAGASLETKLDGQVIRSDGVGSIGGAAEYSFDVPFVTRAASASHTLTLTISDTCDGDTNFTVSDVKLDVVGIK